MMEGYLSDKDQIDMMKKFWNDYGKILLLAVVAGLLIGFGWRYFSQRTDHISEQASVVYQSLAEADGKNDFAQAQQYAAQLQKEYPKSPYGSLAALVWAREAVQKNDLNTAQQQLQWVLDNGRAAPLRQIARLREASVYLEQNKPSDALALLKKVDDNTFSPMIESMRGDVLTKLGKAKEAHTAYSVAKAKYKELGLPSPILDMKLANA